MYYVHNNHDPIVSRETFNKAQEELLRRNALKPATTSTVSAQGRYSRYALTEILHCDECGSRYKRCTWTASGEKQIVWRCINRLQHGKKYCSKSPTVKEGVLHSAIVRAINRFNQENETTYRLLMKASLSDALGIGGSNEEMELLTRRIDTLNAKMMKLINDAVSEGRSIDDNEGEFKEISDEIAQLNSRVSAIKELIANDESAKDRLESINAKVEELKDGITEYDDTIVRQMIECIKVYGDKRIEVIFGGGTSIIEEAKRIKTIVVSVQHSKKKPFEELENEIRNEVLPIALSVFPADEDTEILINPAGCFNIGGPEGDTGLTGRKIMVDTYGGLVAHGGGAFSGKDATKVDRSGAYMARYIAKNIVKAGLAERCQVGISYAIGKAEPIAVSVDSFGTSSITDEELAEIVTKVFDLRPAAIIDRLDLSMPIYKKTSAYGHFNSPDFPWEKTDAVPELMKVAI